MARRQRLNSNDKISMPEDFENSFKEIDTWIESEKPKKPKQNDCGNILLLLFLYILQGIPLGLAGSIPMILQQRHVSYKDQATFSLAFWPFSVKLLWAPFVDSCYWKLMGRRKSWLIPAQYLIGIFMLVLSWTVDQLLDDKDGSPCVMILTSVFFCLNFLAATQDIAVDGWALTILSKENLGWASTCNSVGQTAGFFLGYVVFLALESKEFCINYLGQHDSLVTLPGFFKFWGIIFIVTTSLVWMLKKEKNETLLEGETELGLLDTYKVLLKMLKMPSIQKMIVILLTVKIGFAAADSLTVLKLTEAGVPKEKLALLSIPLTPVQIFLPFYISRFTSGPRPMDTFLAAYVPRLFFGLIFAIMVYTTPYFKGSDGHYSFAFYSCIIAVYLVHQIAACCMFVAQMAFYAQVSDPTIGGTYMTLLNTFTNLGGNWPAWFALRYVSELTWKTCTGSTHQFPCNSLEDQTLCDERGGSCTTQLDGYYVESAVLVVVGLLWYKLGAPAIRSLQTIPKKHWLIKY